MISQAHSANCQTRVDAYGNLHARPKSIPWDQPPVWLSGSHIDSVPHGGKYDGVTGIVVPLEILRADNSVPLELIIFAEEEGTTFGLGMLGSRSWIGELTPEHLSKIHNSANQNYLEAGATLRRPTEKLHQRKTQYLPISRPDRNPHRTRPRPLESQQANRNRQRHRWSKPIPRRLPRHPQPRRLNVNVRPPGCPRRRRNYDHPSRNLRQTSLPPSRRHRRPNHHPAQRDQRHPRPRRFHHRLPRWTPPSSQADGDQQIHQLHITKSPTSEASTITNASNRRSIRRRAGRRTLCDRTETSRRRRAHHGQRRPTRRRRPRSPHPHCHDFHRQQRRHQPQPRRVQPPRRHRRRRTSSRPKILTGLSRFGYDFRR